MYDMRDAKRDGTECLVLTQKESWIVLYWDKNSQYWTDGDWREWADNEALGWFPLPDKNQAVEQYRENGDK